MDTMHADSINAANKTTRQTPAAISQTLDAELPNDGFVPSGIDISRFELPIQYNERVQHYIDIYTRKNRSTFVAWLRRSGRYRTYIETRLVSAGLPRELVYLPLIESGYDPNASSSASAVGLWQFMSGTARAEGLEVSEYVDERRDPFRSTDAAIRHLRGLQNIFGSWYLSTAAYNAGSGRISRLLKGLGYPTRSRNETFWEIQDALPTETRGYVPGLVAATIIGEYPELFGMQNDRRDQTLRFETVSVPSLTALSTVARAIGVPTEEIKELNPHFIKGVTPPRRWSEVRVPFGTAEHFRLAAD
ncbi:MAG TPA: transglycosylase SLT domain-containing protein [Longimicrobiales bacterium]|nr:transglycosylase SLT domain-containing protein [Longimicrobiales bacterium]